MDHKTTGTKTALVELTEAELDYVSGGKITLVTRNPQGHVTSGNPASPSQTQTAENPSGHAPPGQQAGLQ